jgi:hypothetical protein
LGPLQCDGVLPALPRERRHERLHERRHDRVLPLLVDGLAELADPVAESARKFRQALGAEHEQRHDSDEQQMNRILDAHRASG